LSQSDPTVRVPRGFQNVPRTRRSGKVTKQEFVDAVASRANLSRRDAGSAVEAVLDTVTDALKRRDTITFTGFGKFSTSDRAAREGVNPRNPTQKVQIPAATVPKFSAGSQLKAAVKAG
jgi:DNA-binding protein HU-beta